MAGETDDGKRGADVRLRSLAEDPDYQLLLARRSRFTWLLTAVILVIFFGYILLVAFDRELLGRPLGGSAITLGIPIGLGVILISILLTGLYVRRANRIFDPAIRALRRKAGE